jgi:hypothetical protein
MELASLLVRIGITGVGTVESGLSRVDRAVEKTAKKGQDAGFHFEHYRAPLLEAAGAAGLLASNVAQIAAVAGAASGIGIAARFQKLEVGFTNILGSAEKARQLLADLRKLGATTEFNTEDLVGYSRVLLATGSTAQGVTRELRALTDAAAFAGLSTPDVGALSVNLSQIRQALKPELEDLKQFGTRGISLDKVVGAAQGRDLKQGEGIRELQKMTGQQAFDTLIQGFEKAFGGSAAKNAGTLLGVIQNLNEAFGTAMLPTGKLLVPILTSVATGAKAVGEGLGRINEITGGSAGLVFLIGGLWRAKGLLVGTLVTAATATKALTSALAQYSVAAGAAGAASRIPAAQFAPGVGLGAPQGPSNRIGGPFGIRTAISKAGGVLPMLAGFGKNALKFVGKAGIAGLAADLGLNMLGDKVGGQTGGTLKGIGTGVGIGSTLGMIVGSIVPGIGTAIGGAVGAVAGGLIGGIKGYFDSKNAPKGGGDDVAKNTKQMAESLRDIRAEIVGGGRRLRGATSELEIEAAVGRMIATGIA